MEKGQTMQNGPGKYHSDNGGQVTNCTKQAIKKTQRIACLKLFKNSIFDIVELFFSTLASFKPFAS